jgi:hypothetical protein
MSSSASGSCCASTSARASRATSRTAPAPNTITTTWSATAGARVIPFGGAELEEAIGRVADRVTFEVAEHEIVLQGFR